MVQCDRIVLIFFIIFSVLPSFGFALPEDTDEPMHIIADSTLVNYKIGKDVYEGNVKVDQGSSHLRSDRLTTERNKEHKITEAIAYGVDKLAEFTTLPAKGDLLLHAKAKVIKFYPITSIVILEENVIITQGKNSFHGPVIVYNMKDQIVSPPASKNGRATIVIEPTTKPS